jgi:hypothetical protein
MLCLLAAAASGQSIQVKTVPLLSTDQFALVPSIRDDMGGVSLALRDPLQDLWENPARFAGVQSRFLFAPRFNHWSYGQEIGYYYRSGAPFASTSEIRSDSRLLTLPLLWTCARGNSHFSSLIAIQRIAEGNTSRDNFSAGNYPLAVSAGHFFPALRTAAGLSAEYIHLEGMDGVYLLYPDAARISQKGRAWHMRTGFAGNLPNRDAWSVAAGIYSYRLEQTALGIRNMDENEGWFVRSDYEKHLGSALTAAFSVTWDRKHHPKIPEYPLANIPRDPGNTRALNIGAGLKWAEGHTLAAVDLIYQPIDVKTWADAAADVPLGDGGIYRKGDIVQRNDYHFHNLIVRSGGQIAPLAWLELRSGVQMRLFSYDYYQNDFINRMERRGKPQREWTEVDFTSGVTVKLKGLDLGYSLRLQTGTGLLERQWVWLWMGAEDAFVKSDFILPPTVPLNVTPVTYYTHRLTLRWAL